MAVIIFSVLLIFVALIIALKTFLKTRPPGEQPYYDSQEFLLTKAEAAFFTVLVDAIGSSGHIFAKVRIADVLKTRKGISKSEHASAFNAISQKHIDFLVCRRDDCRFILAVELDDSSHGTIRAKKRDALVDRGFCSADIPLFRVKAARTYSVDNIRQLIKGTLAESGDAQADGTRASAGLN